MLVAVKYCVLPPVVAWTSAAACDRRRRRLDGVAMRHRRRRGHLEHRLEALRHLRRRALVLVLEVTEDRRAAVERGLDPFRPTRAAPRRCTRSCGAGDSRPAPTRGPRAWGRSRRSRPRTSRHRRRAGGRAPQPTNRGGTPSRRTEPPGRQRREERVEQRRVVLQRRRALEQHAAEPVAEELAPRDEVADVLADVLELLPVGDPLVRLQREHEPVARALARHFSTVFSVGNRRNV